MCSDGTRAAKRLGAGPKIRSDRCQVSTQLTQERGNQMRRKRFQKGSLQTRKHGRHRVWVVFYWESGERRCKTLGRFSVMSCRKQRPYFLLCFERSTAGVLRSTRPVYTFEQHTQTTCISPSAVAVGRNRLLALRTDRQVASRPEFGRALLSAIRREALQDFLDRKGA